MKTITLNLTNGQETREYSLADYFQLKQTKREQEKSAHTLCETKKQRNDYARAMRIATIIKRGGDVAPADRKFLMIFDAFLYVSAKMAAVSEPVFVEAQSA
ncbi:MAG: hypothetical protein FWE23_11245 [Chitinivibrionia bacterium]|nr:hypothetical protein [Chitinivibrionia bacterium]